jgi:hypothetical protein
MKHTILVASLLAIISLIACAIPPTQITTSNTATVSVSAHTTATTVPVQTPASYTVEETEIRDLVEKFGKRLAMVALLAPDAPEEMQTQYSEFVSPALLGTWMKDVSKAPGRMVSSPWPDRIEIATLTKESPDQYVVTGFVIEITSMEMVHGGAAARIPVHIVVQRDQKRWLISEYVEEKMTKPTLGTVLPQEVTQTNTPIVSPVPATPVPSSAQLLEGPDYEYKSILFTLDPTIGSHLYVFDEMISIDESAAHYTRFSPFPEGACQTWCLNIYPIAEFEQAFGKFVFPPSGYRGGAAVIFKAREMPLSFQNGSGDRGLETHGQNHYGASNESLKYVFRGYTMDKRYAVYVEVPIHAVNLPEVAPTMTTDVAEILSYNQQSAEAVNALTSADFTPHLDLLDAFVLSIRVDTP